ncbi:MAG: phosphatidylglycerol lysyltransferase domain-containing protein, partial [Chloroflexales bacterium]
FMLYDHYCADTIIGHFLKYNPTIRGASEIVIWELAKSLYGTYRYVNLEQDMGIPGLRHFKSSYRPVYKLASLALIRK